MPGAGARNLVAAVLRQQRVRGARAEGPGAASWPAIDRRRCMAQDWLKRSKTLQDATVRACEKYTRNDLKPPYVPLLPGSKLTFRESMAHGAAQPAAVAAPAVRRVVAGGHAAAPNLANQVIDTHARVWRDDDRGGGQCGRPQPNGRAILGFISYGYAQMLLRLDRVEEFLLFLYSHRFHDHTPGSWTAGEVSGINGGTATSAFRRSRPFRCWCAGCWRWRIPTKTGCIWGRGLPREWVASGKEIRIDQAPTRWGRVDFQDVRAGRRRRRVTATVDFGACGRSQGDSREDADAGRKCGADRDRERAAGDVGRPAQRYGRDCDGECPGI